MSVAEAIRFDMLKKDATAAMSQMSRSLNPASRSLARSGSSTLCGASARSQAKSSIALCRGDRRAAR